MDSASARPCFDGTTRGLESNISGLSRHVAVVILYWFVSATNKTVIHRPVSMHCCIAVVSLTSKREIPVSVCIHKGQ